MRGQAKAWITGLVLVGLAIGYLSIWVFGVERAGQLAAIWYVPLIGTLGAIIANTSGTGGGVVFIPVFNALREIESFGLTSQSIVGASFMIQSFGMTMGALTWTRALYRGPNPEAATGIGERNFWLMIASVLALSVPAMLATQRLVHIDSPDLLLAFKTFSILLGSALLLTTWTVNRNRAEQTRLKPLDMAVLLALAVPGGVVTALFSVGIGELVALYLFARHYPLNTCAASAVIISSASVLAGLPFHVIGGTVPYEIGALAIPGALLGGYLARRIAQALGARKLKTLVALWIIGSSLYLIAMNIG